MWVDALLIVSQLFRVFVYKRKYVTDALRWTISDVLRFICIFEVFSMRLNPQSDSAYIDFFSAYVPLEESHEIAFLFK